MLLLHLINQLCSIRDTHSSKRLIDGNVNPLYGIDTLMSRIHLDLRGVMTAPNAGAPADTLPPVENSGIDFPCLIVWTIMHQAIAFLHLLLTIHLNTYPLLIRTSSAEAPGTDHPSVVLLPSPPTL